jgi:hypothetical protein
MRPISVAIGDVYKCWAINDRANIKFRQSSFFFKFSQAADPGGLMSLDVATWCRPVQGFVFHQKCVVAVG